MHKLSIYLLFYKVDYTIVYTLHIPCIYLLFYKVSYTIVYAKHMLSIYNLKDHIIFFIY